MSVNDSDECEVARFTNIALNDPAVPLAPVAVLEEALVVDIEIKGLGGGIQICTVNEKRGAIGWF